MASRANEVVRLLQALRRLNAEEAGAEHDGAGHLRRLDVPAIEPAPVEMEVDQRVLKRPWEEMEMDGDGGEAEVDELETTAEQDMELIRTKRASTTGVGVGGVGQPKSKYRKRSRADVRSRDWSGQRATPPGKCHSCNIRETPEWRRGPDGARTLCNACGLLRNADARAVDYAKLMRKREKEHNGSGAPQIDMDTLRASARADMAQKASNKASGRKHAPAPVPEAPQDPPPPPPPPAHHEGSFQLTLAALSPSEVQAQMGHAPPPAPAPAWASGAQRAYAPEQLQHQSFMRTPQIAGQASPR
ncbi:hypothetical protein B0H17DRAFT_1156169 [Mycena rosella]|uniref:GATA-type domain-containing protein n=1 Tax=Mycena rosella TaxID=1033263 RepID=A0AAD7GXM2_MYCRO|nr:hypothetical protein B0H17DRAFT_1156169 [Mycena rosella]